MIQQKYIDRVCLGAGIAAAALVIWLLLFGRQVIPAASAAPEYVSRLFDESRVHTIDIQVEDWGAFVDQAGEKAYIPCAVEIDGTRLEQVGLRAKGSNSLRLIGEYGLSRYSMVLEFDHYLEGGNYYGLDKLSLDTSFQDNSYLKAYLAYDMMDFMGVPAPLCSYTWVTVNGTDWGLFLATEEPEEAFARRNFGAEYGQLYKPDYRSLSAENADVALRYIDDDPDSYPNLFDNARFSPSRADKQRLIAALKTLSTGENLETAVDVDQVLRYFTVQVFVMNWDSYLGHTGHNYFLYEQDGIISILPWDYNLAFGTYALGMTNPIRDPNVILNYPIYTPAEGSVMLNRPLYHNIMQDETYFSRYQRYFDGLISNYFESGRFEALIRQTEGNIAPYVAKDPTAFCTYPDHRQAVDTLVEICRLRAESVRGQLDGTLPATLREQEEQPGQGVDASGIALEDLGDFEDLRTARARQEEALAAVLADRHGEN